MISKTIAALLPTLLAFGPCFLMMGIPMNPMYSCALAGSVTLSLAACLLYREVIRLERRLQELESKAG